MTLLVTTPPNQDESPLGYYRRLSALNELLNWKELTNVARVARSRTGLLGQCEHVAQELGLDPLWAKRVQAQEGRVRKMERLHRGLHDAICPSCLKKQAYLRLHWEHVYSTACCVHRTQLLDQCDRCGSMLHANRSQIEFCECGRDLRDMPAPAATPSQVWLSALLAGVPLRRNSVGPKIGMVDEGRLAQLVRLLCLFHDPQAAAPQRNASPPRSVSEAICFLSPLESLLEGWPSRYQAHVVQRMKVSDPGATTLNAALGYWYKRLKQICADGERSFLDAVLDVAAQNFPGLLGLDSAGLKGIGTAKPLSAGNAAKGLGVSRDFVVAAIQNRKLTAQVRQFGERKLMFQVPESEVERVRMARARWVDTATALTLLDVPESVLTTLEATGAIDVDRRWREDISKGGAVSLSSLEILLSTLTSRVHVSRTEEDLIALRSLTSRRIGDKLALTKIFTAIVRGDIDGVGPLPLHGIGSIHFRMAEVREYFGTPLLEAGLTIEQLSRMTGWKYESVSHWIKEGILESDSIMLRGQPCRVVMPAQLLRFTREFVPIADLARSIGSRSSSIARKLAGLPVFGAKALPSGVRRGGLVRLRDLTKLALASAVASRRAVSDQYQALVLK